MELLDRQPSENARSYALRVLLHNIITLELAPGSAVSENELSQILKLSRTPVREALIELSKMGLVDIQPQRGSYIAKIDYELVEESRFMRLVLENAVLALVCEGISPEHEEMLVQTWRRKLGILKQATIPACLSWTRISTAFCSRPWARPGLTVSSTPKWCILTG